jgi:hypothetical protein
MNHFLDQYQQGACEQVWNELCALGSEIRSDLLYPEALAVAHETMRRVRVNIELLIPRLQTIGYEFGYEWLRASDPHNASLAKWIAEQPAIYTPPSEETERQIVQFERETGLLPLSLRAFYLEVGSVNFMGWNPHWDRFFRSEPRAIGIDPLVVVDFSEAVLEFPQWKEEYAGVEDAPPEPLYIAPGELEKYYTSGSGGYEMEFPNAAIDGRLLRERHNTTFVNYLRMCLRYGGISGLESIERFIEEELAYLRKDLLPI